VPLLTRATIAPGRITETDQPELAAAGPLTLRLWRDSDAPQVRAAYDDPAMQRWHARYLETDQEASELIARWRRDWTDEVAASWAVVDEHDNLLGRVALKGFDLYEGSADVAYWTTAQARGRGVCPRAVRAAASWAFAVGFHRLELEHSVDNASSCRAADKAGFPAEGIRRSAGLHADGWHDMHVHARVAAG
jgi:ribosomal-protein-alanine N-acetyltransferase